MFKKVNKPKYLSATIVLDGTFLAEIKRRISEENISEKTKNLQQ